MLGYGVELDEKYIDIAKKLSDNAYINIITIKYVTWQKKRSYVLQWCYFKFFMR